MTPKRKKTKKSVDKPSNLANMLIKMRTYSTPQAAKRLGVHYQTLFRWLTLGLIRPSISFPVGGRQVWMWTDADLERARIVKAQQKPGPKRKRRG